MGRKLEQKNQKVLIDKKRLYDWTAVTAPKTLSDVLNKQYLNQ